MYYSNISESIVSEEEAHLQILQVCERWYRIAHPNGNFEDYFIKHSDLILIGRWSSSFEPVDSVPSYSTFNNA